MSNCPKCNKETVIKIYRNMWDTDVEYCTNKEWVGHRENAKP